MQKQNINIVVVGSVNSGKSTWTGVMVSGELDDGNGYARSHVAKHPHELITKRTSDISTKCIELQDKQINLVDLCGHRPYLKTTIYGMLGTFPDYAILVISANKGILEMTLEHIRVLLVMRIPFVIIITKIDSIDTNEKIYNETIHSIKKHLSKYRTLAFINTFKDFSENKNADDTLIKESIQKYAGIIKDNHMLVPVISLSNKTGYFIDVSRTLLYSLEPNLKWDNKIDGSIFYIDTVFNPEGIGIVVTGKLKGNNIKVGSELMLGPYGNNFIQTKVWSIHDSNRNKIDELSNKQYGCFALRILDKKLNFTRHNIKKV